LQREEVLEPKIGIITALEEEYAAMKSLLQTGRAVPKQSGRRLQQYWIGEVRIKRNRKHVVVLTLAGMGTNIAATRSERLLHDFPSVEHIIMTGIAGGCPNIAQPDEHVSLGDIVVSGKDGIVQYDFDKETSSFRQIRNLPRPPSSVLLDAVRLLKAGEHEHHYPWVKFIEEGLKRLQWRRPSITKDQYSKQFKHRVRQAKNPKVFIGPIASANKLLKNPELRDQLRDTFNIKAIEMESSGIADATWDNEIGYLAVRGICDYCDSNKNDEWHNYAAIVAAAYTYALIASLPISEIATPIHARTTPSISTDNKSSSRLAKSKTGDSPISEESSNKIPAISQLSASFGEGEVPLPSWIEQLGPGSCLEMVTLPGGSFLMGSPKERFSALDVPTTQVTKISNRKSRLVVNQVNKFNQCPAHEVRVSTFAIGKYPVTQAQWQAIMDNNPSEVKFETNPVTNVSWEDASAFCKKLSEITGRKYRLPTEAEWEYACRAGIYDEYGFSMRGDHSKQYDLHDYAWYEEKHGSPHPVGLKNPNSYGLYDMHGNVWEWCSDLYAKNYYHISPQRDPVGPRTGKFRVLRGGSYANSADECRAAFRFYQGQKRTSSTCGLRVAMSSRERRRIDELQAVFGKGDESPVTLELGDGSQMTWFEPSISMEFETSDITGPASSLEVSPAGTIQELSEPKLDKDYLAVAAANILTWLLRDESIKKMIGSISGEEAFDYINEFLLLEEFKLDVNKEEIRSKTQVICSKRFSLKKLIEWIKTKLIEKPFD